MAQSADRERERSVCESCELPFYADREGCPYCDEGTTVDDPDRSDEPDEESEFVFESPESANEKTAGGDGDGGDGLVGRLKQALGL